MSNSQHGNILRQKKKKTIENITFIFILWSPAQSVAIFYLLFTVLLNWKTDWGEDCLKDMRPPASSLSLQPNLHWLFLKWGMTETSEKERDVMFKLSLNNQTLYKNAGLKNITLALVPSGYDIQKNKTLLFRYSASIFLGFFLTLFIISLRRHLSFGGFRWFWF